MRTELTEHPFHSIWWGLCIKDECIQAMAVADLFQNDGCVTGRWQFEEAKGSLLVLSDSLNVVFTI